MGTGGRGLDGPAADGGLMGALTGRAGALGFITLSIVLAIALAAALAGWRQDHASLQRRLADMSEQAERSQAVWKAQVAACHAASAPRRTVQASGPEGEDPAHRLLAQGPEGIDGCARMESADQAVLATLK